jgi:hypothetical protein
LYLSIGDLESLEIRTTNEPLPELILDSTPTDGLIPPFTQRTPAAEPTLSDHPRASTPLSGLGQPIQLMPLDLSVLMNLENDRSGGDQGESGAMDQGFLADSPTHSSYFGDVSVADASVIEIPIPQAPKKIKDGVQSSIFDYMGVSTPLSSKLQHQADGIQTKIETVMNSRPKNRDSMLKKLRTNLDVKLRALSYLKGNKRNPKAVSAPKPPVYSKSPVRIDLTKPNKSLFNPKKGIQLHDRKAQAKQWLADKRESEKQRMKAEKFSKCDLLVYDDAKVVKIDQFDKETGKKRYDVILKTSELIRMANAVQKYLKEH